VLSLLVWVACGGGAFGAVAAAWRAFLGLGGVLRLASAAVWWAAVVALLLLRLWWLVRCLLWWLACWAPKLPFAHANSSW